MKKFTALFLTVFGLLVLFATPFGFIAAAYVGGGTSWIHLEDHICQIPTGDGAYEGAPQRQQM